MSQFYFIADKMKALHHFYMNTLLTEIMGFIINLVLADVIT